LLKAAAVGFTAMVKSEKEQKSDCNYIEKCKSFIHSHLYKPFSLDDLADDARVNKSYLSSQFTRIEGMHIREYTHKSRVEAACGMLRYSDKSISSIAEYLCFHSQSHFGSVFKKYVKMTPQQYRSKMKVVDLHNGANNLIKT
jgi:AraC-like DNA-binding protein